MCDLRTRDTRPDLLAFVGVHRLPRKLLETLVAENIMLLYAGRRVHVRQYGLGPEAKAGKSLSSGRSLACSLILKSLLRVPSWGHIPDLRTHVLEAAACYFDGDVHCASFFSIAD